jgi:hypothetical protein
MKTLFSVYLIVAITGAAIAEPACDRLTHYNSNDLQESFEHDLFSNVWSTTALGPEATLYFQEDGTMLAMPSANASVAQYSWNIEIYEGQAHLYLATSHGMKMFTLAPTCSGLCVSDGGKCMMMSVSTQKKISAERLKFIRSQISGTWKYEPSRKAARKGPAGFTLTLGKDGTFAISTGPDSYHSVLEGTWQLAPDGEYLVIFTKQYGKEQIKYIPESLAILSIDYEDLVLDSQRMPRILEKGSMKESLYLSKTNT